MDALRGGTPTAEPRYLHTSAGDLPLQEYRLRVGEHEWAVLHTAAMLTHADEASFFHEYADRVPYGVALWPSSIALAHEIASRAEEFASGSVLELGAGTGLPGIVAASFGARVTQTDRQEGVLSVCRLNGRRNRAQRIAYRAVSWADWNDTDRYDWIIGADVLYGEDGHPHLRRILADNLAAGGRVLLADPFRERSLRFLEEMEREGWRVTLTRWKVGEEADSRAMGVFELSPS